MIKYTAGTRRTYQKQHLKERNDYGNHPIDGMLGTTMEKLKKW
ncbi:MAG: hypothetical protein ACLRRA_03460 [Acutalibacteraceae bacterium]